MYEWDSSKFIEGTIKSMNAAQCRNYLALLNWLDKNPIKLNIGEVIEKKHRSKTFR